MKYSGVDLICVDAELSKPSPEFTTPQSGRTDMESTPLGGGQKTAR